MLHDIFYVLHVTGMAGIIGFGAFLLIKKELGIDKKKKFASIFMSCAHTQLLTGFALFFIMISEINHVKIGLKMLLAIVIAITATLHKRKISSEQNSNNRFLIIAFSSALVVTAIAFLW